VTLESFIGTLIFLLPGFLAYFWIQTFGVNPVMKHTPVEFTTVSALLWIPVSVLTLLLHNTLYYVLCWTDRIEQVWTIPALVKAANQPEFLMWFLILSIVVSFVIGVAWALYGVERMRKVINWIRGKKELAELSKYTSVWDELFLNKDTQIVEVGKIDKPESALIGEVEKASRTFEPERFSLKHIALFTTIVKEKNIPVDRIYVDVKSGTYVKIYDTEEIKKALNTKEEPTSPSDDSDPA
jgi:hypothetical protein